MHSSPIALGNRATTCKEIPGSDALASAVTQHTMDSRRSPPRNSTYAPISSALHCSSTGSAPRNSARACCNASAAAAQLPCPARHADSARRSPESQRQRIRLIDPGNCAGPVIQRARQIAAQGGLFSQRVRQHCHPTVRGWIDDLPHYMDALGHLIAVTARECDQMTSLMMQGIRSAQIEMLGRYLTPLAAPPRTPGRRNRAKTIRDGVEPRYARRRWTARFLKHELQTSYHILGPDQLWIDGRGNEQ